MDDPFAPFFAYLLGHTANKKGCLKNNFSAIAATVITMTAIYIIVHPLVGTIPTILIAGLVISPPVLVLIYEMTKK